MAKKVIGHDLVKVYGDRFNKWDDKVEKDKVVRMLYWGDEVEIPKLSEITDPAEGRVHVRIHNYGLGKFEDGYIKKKKKGGAFVPLQVRAGADKHLLEVTFVDVQQGDATIIQTPDRKVIIVDGGEEVFLARLLASEFPNTTAANPLDVEALVVTHGDADHFSGLVKLGEAATHKTPRKRIHVDIEHYFHNGLVKLPSSKIVNGKSKSRPAKEMFGTSKKVGTTRYATELWDDPRQAPLMNEPFTDWVAAMPTLLGPAATVKRLSTGDHAAFDSFRPDIDIEVLGPFTEQVDNAAALRYFNSSASHTINGHSIVLRLGYENVHFLLGGDLNTHAEEHLRHHIENETDLSLRAEVLKVPHHGSHEYEQAFLNEVNPVVSVVSSGDETPSKDYVHPRANLMAALGRASRGPEPLVFVTELAAFFAYRQGIKPETHRKSNGALEDKPKGQQQPFFFAHERLVFGAVRVRTDGTRVLVVTESANSNVKEAYAFLVDNSGNITKDDLR
jgi:hypothetical protein